MRGNRNAIAALGAGALLFVGFVLAQQGTEQPDTREQQAAEQLPQQFELKGEVQQATGETLRVLDPENNFVVPLAVKDDSRITMQGQAISLNEIPEGAQVRASYAIEGDQLVARQIEVTPSAAQARFQVQGDVQRVGPQTIAIREPTNNFLVDINVPMDVKVTMEGRTIELSDVPEGAEVRASYNLVGNELIAESIVVTAPPQEQPAAPAEQQPQLEPAPVPEPPAP